MTARPTNQEYLPFVERYIRLVPDGDIQDILRAQGETGTGLIRQLSEDQANYRYAEGKWSIKQVIGHLIDNERVWGYRLLRIARNDAGVLAGYDQDIFVSNAAYDAYSRDQLADEYSIVRQSTLAMLRGLPAEAWLRQGVFGDHPLSVRAIPYVIAGHEAHHLNVLSDKYLSR